MSNNKEILKAIDELRVALNEAFYGPDGNELINVEEGEFYGSVDSLKEVEIAGWKLVALKKENEQRRKEV